MYKYATFLGWNAHRLSAIVPVMSTMFSPCSCCYNIIWMDPRPCKSIWTKTEPYASTSYASKLVSPRKLQHFNLGFAYDVHDMADMLFQLKAWNPPHMDWLTLIVTTLKLIVTTLTSLLRHSSFVPATVPAIVLHPHSCIRSISDHDERNRPCCCRRC